MSIKLPKPALLWLGVLALAVVPVRAELISLSASGAITQNSSLDTTIPVGTPWTFEIIYDTAAPDRDFELTGAPDPTYGKFNNAGAIPALTFFHYRAGSYEVTLDDPGDFGPSSEISITFGGVQAIDINLNAAGLFPPLAGRAVSFHADFNDFSVPPLTLTSDGLPTDTTIGPQNFEDSSITLLLSSDDVVLGSQRDMTSFTIAAVPEPSIGVLTIIGFSVLLLHRRRSHWYVAALSRGTDQIASFR
jgi:hypothetical protein